MTSYSFLVLSNAVDGRDDEYNDWYTNRHLPDVAATPGFVSATRFRLADAQRSAPPYGYHYMAIYTPNPVDLTSVKDMRAIAETIERYTKGDLKIRIHLGGTLQIQAPNLSMAVGDEVVQIGDDQQFGGNVPIASILRLPALLRSEEEYSKASDILLPYVQAAYKKLGLTVLATYHYPPPVIFSRAKITSLADISGKKIRTLSPESSEWVRRLGGLPITTTTTEQAPALERGLVDAVTTASSGAGYQLKDLVKYDYRIPIAYSNVYVIVNDGALARLKPATRDVLMRTFSEVMDKTSEKILVDEVDLTKKMAEEGIIITQPSPEDIQSSCAAMVSYWETWSKERGPAAVEALGKIRAAIGR